MIDKLLVTGIGGSLEGTSFSLSSLKFVLGELKKLGANAALVDIKKLNLSLYDYSRSKRNPTAKLRKLMELLHSSDAIIFSSPEYHGTVSAAFKNFIDHLEFLSAYVPPYLTMKPIGCISIGGGENSGMNTLNTLINIAHSLRGITVSSNIAIPNAKKVFDRKGSLKDENVKRRLNRLAGDIFFAASRLSNRK